MVDCLIVDTCIDRTSKVGYILCYIGIYELMRDITRRDATHNLYVIYYASKYNFIVIVIGVGVGVWIVEMF